MSEIPRLDGYHFHEQEWESYEQLYESFEWEVPERFNIAEYVCDRWAEEKGRVALFAEDSDGTERTYTYWQLRNATNQLANYLAAQGVQRGDRIGVNLPQKPETIVAHVAIWKTGAVTVPLSTLFGPNALGYRLDDCEATACIVHESNLASLRAVRDDLHDLETVLTVGEDDPADFETDLWSSIEAQPRVFDPVATASEDDALIAYTSGTTGEPKGVRHAHRVMIGHLPVFITGFCNMTLSSADVFWTPSEWSWTGTMFSIILPALYYGKPVLATEDATEPERIFEVIDRYGVSNAVLHPTTLRAMMQFEDPDERFDLGDVRVILTGGEAVGDALVEWATDVFDDAAIHEGYGQTELNGPVANCSAMYPYRVGKLGKAVPGHEVAIVDPETAEPIDEPGVVGELAIRYEGNPLAFVEYWHKPDATERKVQNGWLLTGDLATVDEDGYYEFESRKDDVIISSGRRIGPEEIENSLERHEAVLEAGVIGVPDAERTEVPKAFVVLTSDGSPDGTTVDELQQYVRTDIAAYAYPREIEFVDALPKTVTGKIRRTELRERDGH